jgi:hypothetical protein
MTDKTNSNPEAISKEEAEKLMDYAQDLSDPVTHVVDYGDLDSDKEDTKTSK